jgi:hypothetical protein
VSPYLLRDLARRGLRALRRRPGRRDAGSLPLAVLMTTIGAGFGGVMAATVVTQIQVTGDAGQRVRALGAAQAGLDVALGQIRLAADGADDDGNPVGDPRELPCTLTGTVDAAGTARYEVTVVYTTADPRGRTDAWLDDPANRLACSPHSGLAATPGYAVLRSKGTGLGTGDINTVAHRRLRATYTFKQTNVNVSGGLVHIYKLPSTTDLCMDAGSPSPAAGTLLRVERCSPGLPQQTFAYNASLNLVLVSTLTSGTGMCLQAASVSGSSTANVTLQPCGTTTQRNQQWGFNSSANFMGVNTAGTLASYCLNVQAPLNRAGQPVIVRVNCGGGYNNEQTWSVEASVGAGMAGDLDRPGFDWLVNYQQFGRCADVTKQNVNYDRRYMIVWPCKQEPNGAVGWNQRFALPTVTDPATGGTGRITTNPGTLYCLRSPLSTAASQYVWVEACPTGTPPERLTWTRYKEHEDPVKSYTIRDGRGYCLQPTDPEAHPADMHDEGYSISKIVVRACDGGNLQKWNAPPKLGEAVPLKDIGENLGED